MPITQDAHVHHHSHGPANRRRRVLETAAPLFVEEPHRTVRGGVIVLHDIYGLTAYIEQYCRLLAGDELLAAAPYHYYDSGGREHGDRMTAQSAARQLTGDGLRDDVAGALDYLIRRRGLPMKAVCAVGFSMGGYLAAWAAAEHSIAAVSVSPGKLDSAPVVGMPPLGDLIRRRGAPWLGLVEDGHVSTLAIENLLTDPSCSPQPGAVKTVPAAVYEPYRDTFSETAQASWNQVRDFLRDIG